jgi:hypothetical protein
VSATNRGSERIVNDKYPTPTWLVKAVLPYVTHHGMRRGHEFTMLEPCCGSGNIVKTFLEYAKPTEPQVIAYDIEAQGYGETKDFLSVTPQPVCDLILTNPPFALAQEFVQRAFEWRRNEDSLVVMLLRLNWFGSKKRAAWLRENMPSSILITPKRPLFRLNKDGKRGTDATEYAWFVWGPRVAPPIVILDTENVKEEYARLPRAPRKKKAIAAPTV